MPACFFPFLKTTINVEHPPISLVNENIVKFLVQFLCCVSFTALIQGGDFLKH